MSEKPKKYCPNCGERVSHRTTRCPYCRQRILTINLVITFILIVVVIVVAIFLFFDYNNIEFFK